MPGIDELAYLDSLQGGGIRPGLERVKALLRAAGHPERAYRSVLVAGTNGKGSTSAALASILEQSSLRTGLYTSPHLVRLEERWRIDGLDIEPGLLAGAIGRLRIAAKHCGFAPTYFEALTVVAYVAFEMARCDVAVMEVGMGGRLDATNVVSPLASVISRIGIDHTDYLGGTIREIAREKAGIIHRNAVGVTSNDDPEVLRVLRGRARKAGVELHESRRDVAIQMLPAERGTRLIATTPLRAYTLESPLNGDHQAENIALAVRAAELLQPWCPSITAGAIERGVAGTKWRGRLERFSIRGRDIWVDGAHNTQAATTIARFIRDRIPSPRSLVFGIMADKDPAGIASILFPLFDEILLTEPPDARAAPVSELRRIAEDMGRAAGIEADPARAVERAVAVGCGQIVVTGSLYLAGTAIGVLDAIAAAASSAKETNHDDATAARRRPN
jgi:dihydrofolate synthase/folylpolyglutamate synthase